MMLIMTLMNPLQASELDVGNYWHWHQGFFWFVAIYDSCDFDLPDLVHRWVSLPNTKFYGHRLGL